MNMSGVTVAFYYYDAWGNITAIVDYNGNAITSAAHIANINPICYRGYYYDSEIAMYYLQSRYYSPELCRFISCDEIEFLGASGSALGYNLFSYCENNPVNAVDPTGNWIAYYSSIIYNYYLISRYAVAFSNYFANRKHDIKYSYINGQDEGVVASFRFGLFKMGYNGCEVISIYNALKAKGYSVSLANIALEMEINGSSLAYGIFGSNPYMIGSYLLAHSVKYKSSTKLTKFDNWITKNGIYIISFWNNGKITGGIHTVAVKYINNQFVVWNRYSSTTTCTNYYNVQSFADIFKAKNGKFIIGYYLNG